MDYIRKCLAAGKSDEEIMSHIKNLISESDASEKAKNDEFDAQVGSVTTD